MSFRSHGAAGHRDANEADVLAPLRAAPGWHVWLLETPCDVLVRRPDGVLFLAEIKQPKTGKLTPGQEELLKIHPELLIWTRPEDTEELLVRYYAMRAAR